MKRFAFQKRYKTSVLPTLLIGAVLVALFAVAAGGIGKSLDKEKVQMTQSAIIRAAVNCYAIEGVYPPNLQYIEQNYGVQIDHDALIVTYDQFSSNIMPFIDVIEKGDRA